VLDELRKAAKHLQQQQQRPEPSQAGALLSLPADTGAVAGDGAVARNPLHPTHNSVENRPSEQMLPLAVVVKVYVGVIMLVINSCLLLPLPLLAMHQVAVREYDGCSSDFGAFWN
jgi:hypothetical protein